MRYNELALFEQIQRNARDLRIDITNDLIHLAVDRVGMTKDQVWDALESDRGLVIYEP